MLNRGKNNDFFWALGRLLEVFVLRLPSNFGCAKLTLCGVAGTAPDWPQAWTHYHSGVTLDKLIPIYFIFSSSVTLILSLIIIDLLLIWLLITDNCE